MTRIMATSAFKRSDPLPPIVCNLFHAEPGGTGRWWLTVDAPPGEDGPVCLVASLSRGQAESAAAAANAALAGWAFQEGWFKDEGEPS